MGTFGLRLEGSDTALESGKTYTVEHELLKGDSIPVTVTKTVVYEE